METKQNTIFALKELAKNYQASIESLTVQIGQGNATIKENLALDEEYKKIDDEIKALQKKRKEIKERAMEAKGMIEVHEKVKALKKEKKEKKLDLSEYLLELQRMSKAESVQLVDGRRWLIKKKAELIRPPKNFEFVDQEDAQPKAVEVGGGV